MRRARKSAEADSAAWRDYVRTAKIRPLAERPAPDDPLTASPAQSRKTPRLAAPPEDAVQPAPAQPEPRDPAPIWPPAPGALAMLDNRKKRPHRMRLDLHGLTIQEAYTTFCQTISLAITCEAASLEVITGQGQNASGRIRHEFPLWIETTSLAGHIVSVTQANARNPGAFLIKLRRPRRSA